MSYNKPILIEVYAEIFFEKGTLPADKLFEIVPKFKEIGLGKVEMDQQLQLISSSESGKQEIGPRPRVRCWNDDKSRLVQIGTDMFVVNHVGQYLGWDKYIALFRQAYEALENVVKEPRCRSVSLFAIDRFEVNKADFRFGEYLNAGGARIPECYKDTKDACDLTLGLGFLEKDGYNRQLNIKVRPSQDTVEIFMQSNFQERANNASNPRALLEKLHDESNECFESIITQRTRDEVMGGER